MAAHLDSLLINPRGFLPYPYPTFCIDITATLWAYLIFSCDFHFHFLEHHRSLCYDITTIRLAYLTICCDFLAESQSLQRNIVGQGPLAACEALHYGHNRYHNHGD
jgi:hypothetical protein